MDDIKDNLPVAMMVAAFTGIAWYVGLELNMSLFLMFKRRRGLYFWSCALSSWGVILQPLFVILADFEVWKDLIPSITMIYLTWLIMVVPQSWVLYSRLHLLMHTAKLLTIIKYVLIFNSIMFSIPTIVIGVLAQSTTVNPALASFNLTWDRVQLVVFFVQETALNVLYIFQTRRFLHRRAPLREHIWSSTGNAEEDDRAQTKEQRSVLWQLLYANSFIIALDITLLGIQCADLFYLQGAFKPCVYAIKLKIEFVILNRLISIVRQPMSSVYVQSGADNNAGTPPANNGSRQRPENVLWHQKSADPTDEAAGVELVESAENKDVNSSSSKSHTPVQSRLD